MKIFNVKALFISLVIILIIGTTLFSGCITFIKPSSTTTTSTDTTQVPTQINVVNPTWTPNTSDDQPSGQLNSIADVVALVKPAVVAINTEVTSYDFFNRPYTEQGAGSGWIIDPSGIIVTNNHVVEGAKTITVTTDAGQTFTADTNSVYTDSYDDLAVIKINASGLPYLKTGDASKLRLGDWVVAIGNALGQGTRVTEGIVSAKDVTLSVDTNDTLYNLIETNAAINPGNSGGPLVNLNGEVIGITSAKISDVGVEGMGYAINIDTAKPIIQELVNKGYVTRPYLGVQLYTVDEIAIAQFGLKVDKGVLIVQISSGDPADKAGLRAGDVIVSLGGKDVATVEDFTTILHAAIIGQPLDITYYRGSSKVSTTVTPVEAPHS